MLASARDPRVAGFTTNPTLMRKAGVADYGAFAREVLAEIRDKPISFEVFADDFAEMERQAREIATWGDNVYVKIPITNTQGEPRGPHSAAVGVRREVERHRDLHARAGARRRPLRGGAASCVSVFAGESPTPGATPCR